MIWFDFFWFVCCCWFILFVQFQYVNCSCFTRIISMLFRLLWLQYIDPVSYISHILVITFRFGTSSIQLLAHVCFKCSFFIQVSLPHSISRVAHHFASFAFPSRFFFVSSETLILLFSISFEWRLFIRWHYEEYEKKTIPDRRHRSGEYLDRYR